MIVPYWTVFPLRKRQTDKDGKEFITAYGPAGCQQDGKFIATAKIKHDSDTTYIGWTGIETYNKDMAKTFGDLERSKNIVVPIDINERQKLPSIKIYEIKDPDQK